jgi:hypothetical protein
VETLSPAKKSPVVVIPAPLVDDYAEAKALHDAFKPTEALYVKLGDELKELVKDSPATETFVATGKRFSLDISAQALASVVDIPAARRKLGAVNFMAAVTLTLKALGNFLTKPEVEALVTKEQTGSRKYTCNPLA